MSAKNYPLVPLGEVLTHRKEFITINDTEIYKRCRVQSHAKGIVLRDTVPGAEINTKRQQVCRKNEFLVAEIDAKVGGFGIVPEELEGAIVSSHYFLFEINEEKLDRRWLHYVIQTAPFREQVAAQGSTNYAAIRPSHVLGYTIPLPPSLAEQQRIVAHIEALAEKIEQARGLRQLAVAEAKYLHNGAAQYLLSNLPKALFSPLRDIVAIKGGGTPSKANPEYWNGNIPWVSPKDMKRREIFDAEDHISEDATLFSPARILEPGAVLIVVRGMIMAHTIPSAILRVPAAINQDMKALIPSACLAPDYLCAALWAYNSRLLALIESSTHGTRKFETPKLLDFEIPVPSLSEQARIIAYLDGLQAQVHAVQRLQTQTAAELDALLPSVLDKAFRT